MKLSQSLEGRKVKIIDVDGELFEGTVLDYIYPDDNDPEGIAAIDIENCPQRPRGLVGFNETDIKTIEIVG